MNPTLEQLSRYVAQELRRGVPEVTLYASLREAGWTQEWINAALRLAKQRAIPSTPSQLSIPPIQTLPHHTMRPAGATTPVAAQQPAFTVPTARPLSRKFKKTLIIVVVILSAITLGLSIYRTINGLQHAAGSRAVRDASRREDLSVLLSNLSDYYLAHNSYPTRNQMNTPSFIDKNGFSIDSITDPKWTPKAAACTKDGSPALADAIVPDCYAYHATTSQNTECNASSAPCTKVKVSIYLEINKQTYSVTFDKNKQVDE